MSHDLSLVLFVHADPVVHELVAGTLGEEHTLVGARNVEQALRRARYQMPAVVVIDCTAGDRGPEQLVLELRALDSHVRAIFLVDSRDAARTFGLADLGTVLPKKQDIDRLASAVRSAARLRAMAAGVERLRHDTGVGGRSPQRITGRYDSHAPEAPRSITEEPISSRPGANISGGRGSRG